MEKLILARHGETDLSRRGVLNGVVALDLPLSEQGRAQALRLGSVLAREPVGLAVVSEFRRTRETVDLALAGRGAPVLVLPELNEAGFGRYEGRPWDEYRVWAAVAPPEERVAGGGESRVEIIGRHVRGYRALLARREPLVLVVGHGLTVRLLLNAAAGAAPRPLLEPVPCAEPFVLERAQVEPAVALLERWCAAPAWEGSNE